MSIRTRRKPMRAVAAAAAAAVGASLLAISGPAQVGAAPSVNEQTRIAGADRYATANAVAKAKVGTSTSNTVVLASGENFPDGLAASALAGALAAGGVPMLLTQAAALPTSVLQTLIDITGGGGTSKNVVIIGGTTVVSADIATQLTALGYTVTRIAGADRYETANEVAEQVYINNSNAIGLFGGYRTAFLANGNNFPDALAASAWAYKNKHPLFLTNGSTLTDGTVDMMETVGVQQIVILGGETAVSAEVATAAAGVTGVLNVVRVSGDTRYDTATALATTLSNTVAGGDAGFVTNAMLVSGTNFPDALAASQLAGGTTAYAIIPVTDPLPAAVSTWIAANQSTLTQVRAIGGTSAIPDTVVDAVVEESTTPPLTATITAVDGSLTFTVAFSAAVADVQNTDFYVVRPTGSEPSVTGITQVGTTNVWTGTVGGVLKPGDVVHLKPASINDKTLTALKVAATSTTVVANTAAPALSIVAYPTTNSATVTGSNGAGKRVWITFDATASISATANVASLLNSQMYYEAPGIGQSRVAPFTGCAYYGGTTFTCDLDRSKAELVAGGRVYSGAGVVSSSASTPVGSASTLGTVTADNTAPVLSSVTFSQAATGANAYAVLGTYVTISARTGTAVAGKAGNAVDLAFTQNEALVGKPTCVYTAAVGATPAKVTITGSTTESAITIADACNGTSSVSALFVANSPTTAALTAAPASTDFANGLDKVTLTMTFSEAVSVSATASNLATNLSGASEYKYVTTATNTIEMQEMAGVITMTVLTDGTATAGLSTLTPVAGSVVDRVGNPLAATAVKFTS